MNYIALIFILSFALFACVPFVALADMHEIQVTPAQRCGPQCVIETIGFDTKHEAEQFWTKYMGLNGAGGHEPYRATNSQLWFVDYQTEEGK